VSSKQPPPAGTSRYELIFCFKSSNNFAVKLTAFGS
jgi:hypothetical protein